MLQEELTLLIFSCDKFSDLWDGQVKLLEKYWHDRRIQTYIVTDKENNRKFGNVELLCAGEDADFTDRVRYALNQVKTEYVMITLDDYFLIQHVKNKSIEELLDIMSQEEIDYMRLYLRYKKSNREQIKDYKGIHFVDPHYRYSINLYPGIWRKSFMEKTVIVKKNPWQYEVSLPKVAIDNNAKCAMSKRNEYIFLDVVRKGKILNKANRYLTKNDLYHGDRPVHTKWYELKLGVKTITSRYLPTWMVKRIKRILSRFGFEFYS